MIKLSTQNCIIIIYTFTVSVDTKRKISIYKYIHIGIQTYDILHKSKNMHIKFKLLWEKTILF